VRIPGEVSWLKALRIVLATVIVATAACGGGSNSQSCATGGERCPCFGNATCNAGLVCLSQRCVRPVANGGAGGGAPSSLGGRGGAGLPGAGGATAAGGAPLILGSGGSAGAGLASGSGGGAAGGATASGAAGSDAGGGHTGGNGGAIVSATGGNGGAIVSATGGNGGLGGNTRGNGGNGGLAGGPGASGAGGAATGGGGAGARGGSPGTAGGSGIGGRGGGPGTTAHAFSYGPAISSNLSQALDIFAVGADGHVWFRQYYAGWSSWLQIPGISKIASDVDAYGGTFMPPSEVFGVENDGGKVMHQHYTNGAWLTAWENFSVSPPTELNRASYGVSATQTGNTRNGYVAAWLFAVGSTDTLWSRSWNGTTWSAWTRMHGVLVAAPDAVSRPGVTWVVARLGSGQIAINTNNTNLDVASAWSGFQSLPPLASGAAFTHGPCITAWSDTHIDVFSPGDADKSLWHNVSTDGGFTWNVPSWEDWGNGPTIASSVDCVAWSNGRIDLVVIGTDGHLWRRTYDASLQPWEDMGVY